MSAETILPPEGPVGPGRDPEQKTSLLLSQDTCDNGTRESTNSTTEPTKTSSPREHCTNRHGHMTGENHIHDDLVRTQPQPLPVTTTSAPPATDGEAARSQNGVRAGLSNGHGGSRQHRAGPPAEQEGRNQPSPVAQKMQRKLRSSLSVHSDSSRRSKASSTGSHKPGSTPEDCCVHCILACLFCEFLALCNMVVAQASCGTCTSEACCCCCSDELGEDCNCPCDMDCGVMDACCESSDCLEICMECCGICFPT